MRLTVLLLLLLAATGGIASGAELTIGLIPADNNEQMVRTFEPMRAYLESKLGEPVKLFTATDYTSVIEAMKKKRIDCAFFGPLSYCLAEEEAGAEAFAVGVLKGKENGDYHSIIVVPADSPVKTIADLAGKNVAFVDPASTSGGLMPTLMVKQATGKMPQDFFGKLTYAGSHDAAEMAVKNHVVDAAADNDITYPRMVAKGLISPETNRIIATSEALPGSPLAYRSDLPEELKAKLRDIIYNAHKDIQVTGYGTLSHYGPVSAKDYACIHAMIAELGLRREQMLHK